MDIYIHGHECHGVALNNFLELLIFLCGKIEYTTYIFNKHKNLVHKFEFIWDLLKLTQGQNYTYRVKNTHTPT